MSINIPKLKAKNVAGYMLLPGVIPRLKELMGGFGYLAYVFANVFGAVRILPAGHDYLQAANIGKFGVVNVIAAAANNLVFDKKHLDQIVIFGAIMVAVILLFLQFALLFFTVISGQAFAGAAATPAFTSIFLTENPQTDVAFLMLDYVFGIPDLFGSNALGVNGAGVTAFHHGLHALFRFYNMSILLVGVLIFLYYVMVVVVETAQTGVPFGKRFSKIYAPLRLIIAIGLLVPLNYGFNGAQYITFYAAKLGSSLATNGWITYNNNVTNPMGVSSASLVTAPNTPSFDSLMYFSSVYHSCRTMYNLIAREDYGNRAGTTIQIQPYIVVDNEAEPLATTDYREAKALYGSSDIEIVLGEQSPNNTKFPGGVRPYCGKLTISLNNQNPSGYRYMGDRATRGLASRGGVKTIEEAYYNLVLYLFDVYGAGGEATQVLAAMGERAAYKTIPGSRRNPCHRSSDLGDGRSGGPDSSGTCLDSANLPPPGPNLQSEMTNFKNMVEISVEGGVRNIQRWTNFELGDELRARGWGGAGIWYNRIAEVNGNVTAAIYSVPTIKQYPEVMEFVKKQRQQKDTFLGPCKAFEPNLADGDPITFAPAYNAKVAEALYMVYAHFSCDQPAAETAVPLGASGNVFVDVISVIFGINGLFELREKTRLDMATGQPATHPLAALSTIGKSLLENAIRSMAWSVGASFGGGMEGILGKSLGAGLQSFSRMFVGIATIGLTAGFLLYYILPFLPFIYFFFAVGSWVKSIFEAMVGAPLWALAHLRIDGDGLPGRAALSGYLLIFEIMLRPIATICGLIGGMAIFGTMVAVMNYIFDVVVSNVGGATPDGAGGATITVDGHEFMRLGVIDQFFFTLVYAILVYMMATSCFKMIDQVPKHFMSWLGSQVGTFNDNMADPTENLSTYTTVAANQFVPKLLEGTNDAARAGGKAIDAAYEAATTTGTTTPQTPTPGGR